MVATIQDISLAEHAYNRRRLIFKQNETIQDILEPSYWQHIAQELKPGDIIEALKEDFTLFVELFVLDVSRLSAKVKILKLNDFTEDKNKNTSDTLGSLKLFEIKHLKATKWCICRISDGQILHSGFQVKEDAEKWLEENIKTLI